MIRNRLVAGLLVAGLFGVATPIHAATAPAGVAVPQPALAALAAPRGAELNASGIHRIVAREGNQWRDLQVLTAWGAIYFPWPRGVAPAAFELDVGSGGAVSIRAAADAVADRARYAAAFDAVIDEATRRARDVRATAERPRP